MCHLGVPAGTRVPDVRTEEVLIDVGNATRMPSLLAIPNRTPAPAVLMINGAGGRMAFAETLTRRVAAAGFVALNPEFFFRLGDAADYAEEARATGALGPAFVRAGKLDLEAWPRDLDHAADWLLQTPYANGKLGTVGFCMGGSAAFLMAARRADVAATVSYYGFGLGHNFLEPLLLDGTAPGHEDACASWQHALEFLRAALTASA